MSQHELAKIAFEALLNEVDAFQSQQHRKYQLITSLVLRHSTALAPPKNGTVALQGTT